MNKVVLLSGKDVFDKRIHLDEHVNLKDFSVLNNFDFHESDCAELISKLIQIDADKKTSLERCEYENAAQLRDNEWQLVMWHFNCKGTYNNRSSEIINNTLVYLVYYMNC